MPIIMVGALETIGIEGECSTPSIEFRPPSYKRLKISMKGTIMNPGNLHKKDL